MASNYLSKKMLDMIDCLRANNTEAINYERQSEETIEQLCDLIEPHHPPCLHDAYNIRGLSIIPNYLSLFELEQLRNYLENCQLSNSRGIEPEHIYYGCTPDNCSRTRVPAFLRNLLVFLRSRLGLITTATYPYFNQVCITRYKPKQQRSFCIDSTQLYGPRTVCLIIGPEVAISFKSGCLIKHIKIDSRTLCVLTEDSRNKWCYGIKNNTDQTIYSIIFRTCNNLG